MYNYYSEYGMIRRNQDSCVIIRSRDMCSFKIKQFYEIDLFVIFLITII